MIKSIHIVLINILGIISMMYYCFDGITAIGLLGAALSYFIISCLGITVTFHRFLTHKSYDFRNRWLEKIFVLFGSLAGTGSALGWVAVHRQHHIHSDKDSDVHGPKRGWKNFVAEYDDKVSYKDVRDLIKDKYIIFLHKYGLYVLLLFYLVLFIIGGLNMVLVLGIIPQTLTSIVSALCNWFAHTSGYRTYDTDDDSRNNAWLALITWGDSWHNNHHKKPWLYSFKHKWWELDISGLVIKMVKK